MNSLSTKEKLLLVLLHDKGYHKELISRFKHMWESNSKFSAKIPKKRSISQAFKLLGFVPKEKTTPISK